MLKFAKYLSFILTFCNLTAETQNTNNAHNFYLGVSLNQCSLAGKRSDSASDRAPVTVVFTDNKRVHSDGVYGGILLGYLFRFQNFGIGTEFFYNYGKLESKISGTYINRGLSSTKFTATYKISNQAGGYAKLGYFLDSYFLYTLFGIHSQTGRFESTGYHQNVHDVLTQHEYRTNRKTTSTFSYGFGVQKAIAEHYAIGIECKFANIPNKTFTWTLNEPTNTTLASSFKYQLRSIGLKLMYVF